MAVPNTNLVQSFMHPMMHYKMILNKFRRANNTPFFIKKQVFFSFKPLIQNIVF
ncbi:hypothetical protein AsAng_0058690 [Aureispira anguillae]|uniref:Uncharacterized protein n=1 Tax=Aureispira anguillae TaxID=2864201 RepID=A0A916DWU8_9BACT|nr:hypothetical protein AsAng_0058690 [Aureispira anguillae]